jgi:hypothetical protein
VRSKIMLGLLAAVVMLLGAAVAQAGMPAMPPGPPPGMPPGPPPGMTPDFSGGPPPGMDAFFPNPDERNRMWSLAQRAMSLRMLDDADVRAEIGMTPDQEKKLQDLKDSAMSLGARIRDDMQAKFQNMQNMSPEERQAARQEMMQSIGQAARDAAGAAEKMLGDAEQILTPEQKAKLVAVTTDRSTMEDATGGLSILLTQQGKDACTLTGDHVTQIRTMLDALKAEWKSLRDKAFGPDKVLTPADMQTDKYKEFKAAHQELITQTRDRILLIFSGDHRTKVQQFLASRVGNLTRTTRATPGRATGATVTPIGTAPAAAPGAPAPATNPAPAPAPAAPPVAPPTPPAPTAPPASTNPFGS